MSNRVIKDKIWSSPTLSNLSIDAELQWPRWLLMADDWGCFNADPRVIKGMIFPLRDSIKHSDIGAILSEYVKSGLIFVWQDGLRSWGFFTGWNDDGSFCNKTNMDGNGKQIKHRRRTPEPPMKEFSTFQDKLGRLSTSSDKILDPNPNPNPNPDPNKDTRSANNAKRVIGIWMGKYLKAFGQKYIVVQGKDHSIAKKLSELFDDDRLAKLIDDFLSGPICERLGASIPVFYSVINQVQSKKKEKTWQEKFLEKGEKQ